MEKAFELYVNLKTSEYKRTPIQIKKCNKKYRVLSDHRSDNKVYSLISLNHNLSCSPLKFIVHYEPENEDKALELLQNWLVKRQCQFKTLLTTIETLGSIVDIDRVTKVFEKE